jgi:hypothetical protein
MTLEQMKSVDIRTIDRDSLVDAGGLLVDIDLPKIERMRGVKHYLGNPYCFKCGKVAVKISYAQTTATIDDRMESFLRTQ